MAKAKPTCLHSSMGVCSKCDIPVTPVKPSCPKCGSLRTEQRALFTGMYTHCLACDEPREPRASNPVVNWARSTDTWKLIDPSNTKKVRTKYGYGSQDPNRGGPWRVGMRRPHAGLMDTLGEAAHAARQNPDFVVLEYAVGDSLSDITIVAVINPRNVP